MSKYILVVDDNPSDLILTSFLVEQQGYIAIRAKNGFDALEKMEEFPLSAFIIDLQMPHMSGLEFIRRIRTRPEHETNPILVLSARREERDVRLALQYGSNDYIVKPVDTGIFEGKIQRLLGKNEGWTEAPLSGSFPPLASLEEFVEIVSISEVGLTLIYKVEPRKGETRKLNSSLLEENGLENLQIVVRSYDKMKDHYQVRASFVGLPESSLKKLRILCKNIWAKYNNNKGKLVI